jgi:RNA polymerase sigma-70 factor (ECF subfamily)
MNDMIAAIPGNHAENYAEELVCTFEEVGPYLLNTLFRLIGNYSDAQDASQETFLKCWRARTSATRVRDMRAWIFRVGINTVRDAQRCAWRRRALPLAFACGRPASEASPGKNLEEREDLDLLHRAITHLRVDERAVFLLRQNDGLSYAEIARLRNSPVGSVKTHMRRALTKLRRALRDTKAD